MTVVGTAETVEVVTGADDEVVIEEGAVYDGLGAILTVVVAVALPEAVEVEVEMALTAVLVLPVVLPPEMENGNEYWKVVGAESS